jgi:hypothetical protein
MYGEKSLYKSEVTTQPGWFGMPLDEAIDGALAVAMGAGKPEVAYA